MPAVQCPGSVGPGGNTPPCGAENTQNPLARVASACDAARVPRIRFETKNATLVKEVDEPEGGSLLDICDKYLAPIPFSCRSASCATCHIEILEGAELIEVPESEEQDLLDIVAESDADRLACQARVKAGPGLIRLRPYAEP